MTTAEGTFPKVGGDPLYVSEINAFHNNIAEVYTGSDIDNNTNNHTESYELTPIDAANLASKTYIKIRFVGTVVVALTGTESSSSGYVKLKAQIKEIGGAYADIIGYKNVGGISGDKRTSNENTCDYSLVFELTAGMKTNGCQIQIFSNTTASGTMTVGTSFTNIQTVIELL